LLSEPGTGVGRPLDISGRDKNNFCQLRAKFAAAGVLGDLPCICSSVATKDLCGKKDLAATRNLVLQQERLGGIANFEAANQCPVSDIRDLNRCGLVGLGRTSVFVRALIRPQAKDWE
jgi:hypothetical protein